MQKRMGYISYNGWHRVTANGLCPFGPGLGLI